MTEFAIATVSYNHWYSRQLFVLLVALMLFNHSGTLRSMAELLTSLPQVIPFGQLLIRWLFLSYMAQSAIATVSYNFWDCGWNPITLVLIFQNMSHLTSLISALYMCMPSVLMVQQFQELKFWLTLWILPMLPSFTLHCHAVYKNCRYCRYFRYVKTLSSLTPVSPISRCDCNRSWAVFEYF